MTTATKKKSSSSKVEERPRAMRKDIVDYNHEGNTKAPMLAIAVKSESDNGMLDLLVLPDTGGDIIRKYSVPHHSDFEKLTNPNARRNGSWS